MKERVMATAIAGGLLVGSAFVVATVSNPGVAVAQEDQDQEAADERISGKRGAILEEVLDDLVSSGTITEEQREAIADAVMAKAEELKSERQEVRELISGFLDDDVITAEELDQLPDGHPFTDPDGRFGEALEDGELTRDEIQDATTHPRRDSFRAGARFGALLDDGGIDQEEYDALPEDHPLKQVDVSQYLDDGLITVDELRELRESQSESGDAA